LNQAYSSDRGRPETTTAQINLALRMNVSVNVKIE